MVSLRHTGLAAKCLAPAVACTYTDAADCDAHGPHCHWQNTSLDLSCADAPTGQCEAATFVDMYGMLAWASFFPLSSGSPTVVPWARTPNPLWLYFSLLVWRIAPIWDGRKSPLLMNGIMWFLPMASYPMHKHQIRLPVSSMAGLARCCQACLRHIRVLLPVWSAGVAVVPAGYPDRPSRGPHRPAGRGATSLHTHHHHHHSTPTPTTLHPPSPLPLPPSPLPLRSIAIIITPSCHPSSTALHAAKSTRIFLRPGVCSATFRIRFSQSVEVPSQPPPDNQSVALAHRGCSDE